MTKKLNSKIKIKLLSNHPECIPRLSEIHYEGIARHYVPGSSSEKSAEKLRAHLNVNKLPLTYVALYEETPVGMASLRVNDGIRPDLEPWLGSLVVDPEFRGKGIGEQLINVIKSHAVELEYQRMYLLTFDATLPTWYERLGWSVIGDDILFENHVTVMSVELGNKN